MVRQPTLVQNTYQWGQQITASLKQTCQNRALRLQHSDRAKCLRLSKATARAYLYRLAASEPSCAA